MNATDLLLYHTVFVGGLVVMCAIGAILAAWLRSRQPIMAVPASGQLTIRFPEPTAPMNSTLPDLPGRTELHSTHWNSEPRPGS
ncbi:hypothetical protein SAMN06265222_113116 [Neorhodopirellula lusitana]|uniref:Uncharacterized protein n=1 Tax=Neorhodopirellula lusitana TaxID=445327 RepID=A0ABY1QGN5_9BACT|nr:hypothetical protein [Neorhodopirellula lusitana]SMP70735.1 hypothetical protein SAMN06265222_113116 [Neorhodopirellula lusitana]